MGLEALCAASLSSMLASFAPCPGGVHGEFVNSSRACGMGREGGLGVAAVGFLLQIY